MIGGNEIRHTFNRHGKGRERDKGQLPITPADMARIPEILSYHDKVEKGSPENQTGATTAKISKKFQDSTNYSIFVIADTLRYKTMWK